LSQLKAKARLQSASPSHQTPPIPRLCTLPRPSRVYLFPPGHLVYLTVSLLLVLLTPNHSHHLFLGGGGYWSLNSGPTP
jgi:hypothetical protein